MRFYLLIFFFMSFLNAGEKVALLIGNTEYKFQPLSNPVNDVRAIKKTLIKIGFKKENVMVLENVSQQEIKDALYSFRQTASNSEIALVYFSGHGMQVNDKYGKSVNYMFPANTSATTPLDLMGLVDLNYFIDSTSSAKYGIVLVDACRNNPLVNYFQEGKHKGSTAKRGLGQVSPKRKEVIIGFATDAGNIANDGKGNNSPYAKALTSNLKLNLDIRMVLGQVGLDVAEATHSEQNPILKSTLGRYSVCLTGKCKNGLEDEVRRLKNENEKLKNKEIDERSTFGGNEIYERNDFQELERQKNNLVFQNQPSTGKYTWEEAFTHCKSLNLNTYTSWRLPKKDELKSLVKSDIYTFDTQKKWEKWFKKNHQFKDKNVNKIFWSSTPYIYNNDGAWFIDFSKSYEDWTSKNKSYSVICVQETK